MPSVFAFAGSNEFFSYALRYEGQAGNELANFIEMLLSTKVTKQQIGVRSSELSSIINSYCTYDSLS